MNAKAELNLRQEIDKVIDSFDFSKVEKVMQFLDWKIFLSKDDPEEPEAYVVPNIQQLIKEARIRIFDAAERAIATEEVISSCAGPFKASVYFDREDDEFSVDLMFVVEESFNW